MPPGLVLALRFLNGARALAKPSRCCAMAVASEFCATNMPAMEASGHRFSAALPRPHRCPLCSLDGQMRKFGRWRCTLPDLRAGARLLSHQSVVIRPRLNRSPLASTKLSSGKCGARRKIGSGSTTGGRPRFPIFFSSATSAVFLCREMGL